MNDYYYNIVKLEFIALLNKIVCVILYTLITAAVNT